MSDLGFSFNLHELWHVAGTQIILLLWGMLLMIYDILVPKRVSRYQVRIPAIGWLCTLGFVLALAHVVYNQWNISDTVLMGVFSMEKFTVFLTVIILVSAILVSLSSIGFLLNNANPRCVYFVLLTFATYGCVAFVQSVDLLMMFIALEVMSLAIYILAAFLKYDRFCVEGSLKYFLLGSFGSAFFLFGIAMVYGFTGTVNLSRIAVELSKGMMEQPLVLVAMAMIMAGLFFKMALVPFHMWAPDVYEGSPSVVTGFMATAVKTAAFGAFIKVLFVAFSPLLAAGGNYSFVSTSILAALGVYWKPVLWWLALLTMFFGNLLALSQQNIKRMLAYSSVAHAGYMALGIIAANGEGRAGVLFYLFSYTLMNLGAFAVVYVIDGFERNAQTLSDYRGLGYRAPALSFLISLFLVAMAGLPPTAGFLGKFYVFSAAIKEGYFLLAALGVMTSVMGAYYYLRVVYMLYMKDPVRDIRPAKADAPTIIALALTALGVVYLGIMPEGLYRVAEAAAASLAFTF